MIDFGARDTDNLIALVKKFDGKVQLNWCSITLCELSMLINHYIEREYKPAFMPEASSVCPLCGVDSPHQHTPLEQVIYTNGVKRGIGYKVAVDDV